MSLFPDQLPGIDLKDAMARVGVAPEVFLPIVKRFAEIHGDLDARLLVALKAGDLSTLRTMVHTLKGASAGIGAYELQDHCLDLEIAAHQGTPVEEITDVLKLVNAELNKVLASISTLD